MEEEKKYNNKIDVIIPAYNVPDNILFRCLASIACQDIIDDIEVTIVDDASTEENYQRVADIFKSVMKINVLHYKINGGPGVARQYGIDHTSNGFITFVDTDDTLNGTFALKCLRNNIERNLIYYMCVGIFDRVVGDQIQIQGETGPFFEMKENDLTWLFGKLYRRSYIDKYNIHFHSTSRANEDLGFNLLCRLCASDDECILFIDNHVYYWHENPNSITHINNYEYSYISSSNGCFYGYVENAIFAIQEAKKRKPSNDINIFNKSVYAMFYLYKFYLECYVESKEHAESNFEYCKIFYNEIYKEIEKDVTEQIFSENYNIMMSKLYLDNELKGHIPHMTIYEFFDRLKEDD